VKSEKFVPEMGSDALVTACQPKIEKSKTNPLRWLRRCRD